MKKISYPYTEFEDLGKLPTKIYLLDHLGGFTEDYKNILLDRLQEFSLEKNKTFEVTVAQIMESKIRENYKSLNWKFDFNLPDKVLYRQFFQYKTHPEINYKNFICCFNGSSHVSRKLLVSILHKFGWFDGNFCSKNFVLSLDMLDGHIKDYIGNNGEFYRKFFISDQSENFLEKIFSFGHVRFEHDKNIYNLENKITQSFLHIVSETMATSYYPHVTEKFLYSVVTRGLFLSYAQPGWHDHLERYYGFKKFTRIFDYKFDLIKNPIQRLIEIMTMISKFSILSRRDWQDLYEMEKDTIEYNYDHYFSRNYLKTLENFVNCSTMISSVDSTKI